MEHRSSIFSLKVLTYTLLGICITAELLACLQLGLEGPDSQLHIQWLGEVATASKAGVLYPRWLPQYFEGLGAPVFYFYPPLTYFLGELAAIVLPVNGEILFRALAILSSILSCITAYLFLKELRCFSKDQVLLGALLYAFAPYRFFDLSIRNAIAEGMIFVFIPLLFLGIEYAATQRPLRGLLLICLSWACCILTHIPGTIICALFLPIYLIVRFRKQYQLYALTIFSLLLGTASTAFFWYPIPFLTPYIHLEHLNDFYNIHESVYSIVEFFRFKNITTHLICALAAVSLGVLLWLLRKQYSSTLPLVAMLAFSLIFQLPLGIGHIWNTLFPFTMIQFPARFLILGLLAISWGILWIGRISPRKQLFFILLCVLLPLPRIVAFGFNLQLSQKHTSTLDETAKVPFEYLPRTARNATLPGIRNLAALPPLSTDSLQRGEGFQVSSKGFRSQQFTVQFANPHTVKVRQYFWPFWKMFVGATPYPTRPDSNGLTQCDLPQGNYTAELRLIEPDYERTGKTISYAGILGIILAVVMNHNRKQGKND